ncbi:MAG: hypothetical protein ACLFV6_06755 [Spirulinaceae cyanobacterium]
MSINSTYPMRAFVRHKAQIQLQQQGIIVDADLLQELATTQMQADEGGLFNQACPSPQQAAQLEDRLAEELVASYQRIQQQQQDPLIQELNQTLTLEPDES